MPKRNQSNPYYFCVVAPLSLAKKIELYYPPEEPFFSLLGEDPA